MLLKQLTQIQEALDSYFISGIEPVIGAAQSTLLRDVANVVTVAGALPALPAAIQSALSLLSK